MVFKWVHCIYFFCEEEITIAKEKDLYINEKIRANEVMLIGPNGEQLGVKLIKDALTLANYAGFDLVLISPQATPPVCKIMDYNKFKYETQRKNKENLKRQRETNLEMKEYRLSVKIDVHDFDTRVRNAGEYLKKGHRVKATVRFKGREMVHPELGREVLIRFANALSEVSELEKQPVLDGKFMSIYLMPKKDK